MKGIRTIEHKGIIKKITDELILVSIIVNTSCASCEAKGACSASELDEKEVEVRNFSEDYRVGEQVVVFFDESLGFRALFLGYILPFIVLMIVLLTVNGLGYGEGTAGLMALGSLVPYYLIIYLTNKKLKKTFSFSIRKLDTRQILSNAEFNF